MSHECHPFVMCLASMQGPNKTAQERASNRNGQNIEHPEHRNGQKLDNPELHSGPGIVHSEHQNGSTSRMSEPTPLAGPHPTRSIATRTSDETARMDSKRPRRILGLPASCNTEKRSVDSKNDPRTRLSCNIRVSRGPQKST